MTLDTDWKSAGRHRMERYLVGDAERNQTIQPGKRGVARSPMNDIAFLKNKASEVSAVLTGYAGDEGHLARSDHHCTMP
jgi:hypothetical protein